jgi:hypothetical protein
MGVESPVIRSGFRGMYKILSLEPDEGDCLEKIRLKL